MRRQDKLDVHDGLVINFHDEKAVFSKLFHFFKLVQIVKILGKFNCSRCIRILGYELASL